MATANEREDVVDISEFTGLNNVDQPERIGRAGLVIGQNVEVTQTGSVRRRNGMTQYLPGNYKDLASWGPYMYAIKDGTDLMQITDASTETQIDTLTVGGQPIQWLDYVGGRLYYTNGIEARMLVDGTTYDWGIPATRILPAAADIPGSMDPGWYLFNITFEQRGGTSGGSIVENGMIYVENGGIRFSNVPVATHGLVDTFTLWLSGPNGSALYYYGSYDNGTTTFDVTDKPRTTAQFDLHWLQEPPVPTGPVAQFHNYTLVCVGDTLYRSQPFSPELFNRLENNRFSDTITMVAPLESGVYLGTDSVIYWLDGRDPAEWSARKVFEAGAVPGTLGFTTRGSVGDQQTEDRAAIFTTTEGVCVGLDGGNVTNFTQDSFDFPSADRGVSLTRTSRGTSQYVLTLEGDVGDTATGDGGRDLPAPDLDA